MHNTHALSARVANSNSGGDAPFNPDDLDKFNNVALSRVFLESNAESYRRNTMKLLKRVEEKEKKIYVLFTLHE